MTPREAHTAEGEGVQPAPATRQMVAGWRDPRLVLGVLIVAASVLIGSVVFAHADDTTMVWGVRRALPIGSTLTAGDLETRRVGLDGADLARYLRATGGGPVGQVLQREVGAGELLPAGALAAGGGEIGVRVPLAVGVADLPASVQVGTVVDVWVTGREGSAAAPERAVRAFEQVRVVAITRDRDSLAPETVRSVIVLVPGALDEQELGELIGRTASGRVILTQAQGTAAR